MGLVGIDEAGSKECGVLTLDLLVKCGILQATDDGKWELAADYEKKLFVFCAYGFGFFRFVWAFQMGDSIAIENGYQDSVPV